MSRARAGVRLVTRRAVGVRPVVVVALLLLAAVLGWSAGGR